MAQAPGHTLGQIIGNVLEEALRPVLQRMADRHALFLDAKGPRPLVRPGQKVTWTDDLGNAHDLDFVLERGGSSDTAGNPAAFVETAWRRYTKHSKAKAQEIQGAVLPLVAKWASVKPTPAAVVAGEWTAPSLKQLETSGFVVLHLNFPKTVAAFANSGIDIVGRGEGTTDAFWQEQVDAYSGLTAHEKLGLAASLRSRHESEFDEFVGELERRVIRTIEYVVVLPLHGVAEQFASVGDAIASVSAYDPAGLPDAPFVRFEIRIRYTNGDVIEASFGAAHDAVSFLQTFT